MEVRVLGPVRVLDRGRLMLRARRRERLLLGLLALEPGRPVASDRLERLLWAGDAPANPRAALQVSVSRLRTQLAGVDGRPGLTIQRDGAGYVLPIAPEKVDAHRFRVAVTAARSIEHPRTRARRLREALALWSGPLLADVADDRLRRRLGTGLEEFRLAALELRVTAELDAGDHESLVAELADLTAEYPHRERLIAARMRALYRCGRVGEALEVYRDTAAGLAERTGLDCGEDLNDLYVAMLRRDSAPAADRPGPARSQLPPDLSSFTGRTAELERIVTLANQDRGTEARPVVCVVDGMAGVGKTALAVHAGHRLAAGYPDGRIFVDLHGFAGDQLEVPPAEALDRMLRALGVTGEAIPNHVDDRAAAWRGLLAERRVLIVLDNAADEDQVRPLIPAAVGCLVLITSRRRLATLEDAEQLPLSPLRSQEAGALFARLAGSCRLDGEADLLTEIAELCAGLPLAIRLAAARLADQPYWTLSRLVKRLRDSDHRLAELDSGRRGVTAALEVSYADLDAAERRAFRLLSLSVEQPMDNTVAAALLGTDVDEADTRLLALAAARLLQPCGLDRYRFHDLVGEYAGAVAERDEAEAVRHQATARLLDYYLAAVNAATHQLDPGRTRLEPIPDGIRVPRLTDRQAALAWFDTNRPHLKAAVSRANAAGFHEHAWRIAASAALYHEMRKHHADWLATHQIGLESAARLADDKAQVSLLYRMIVLHHRLGDFDAVVECGRRAMDLSAGLGDELGRASILNNLGSMYADIGDAESFDRARSHLEAAQKIYGEQSDVIGAAKAAANLGELYRKHDRDDEALTHHHRALRLFRDLGRPLGQAFSLRHSGEILARRREDDAAAAHLTEALDLSRRHGSLEGELECLERLGELCREQGRIEAALDWHERLRQAVPEHYPAAHRDRMNRAIAASRRAAGLDAPPDS